MTSEGKTVPVKNFKGVTSVAVVFPPGCVIGKRAVSLELLEVQGKDFDLIPKPANPNAVGCVRQSRIFSRGRQG